MSTCLISSRSSSLPPSCRWFLINLTRSLLSIALRSHCTKPSTDKAATKTIQNHRKAYTFSVYMLMGSTHCTVYRCMFPNRRTLQKEQVTNEKHQNIETFKLGRPAHYEFLMYIYHPDSEGMGKVLFSQLCVCSQGGGGGGYPISILIHPLVLCPFKGWGTPVPGPMSLPSGVVTGVHPIQFPIGRTPIQCPTGGRYPGQVRMEVPPPIRTGWGCPPSPPGRQSSTCYEADGMSLAFTQEDFLVVF